MLQKLIIIHGQLASKNPHETEKSSERDLLFHSTRKADIIKKLELLDCGKMSCREHLSNSSRPCADTFMYPRTRLTADEATSSPLDISIALAFVLFSTIILRLIQDSRPAVPVFFSYLHVSLFYGEPVGRRQFKFSQLAASFPRCKPWFTVGLHVRRKHKHKHKHTSLSHVWTGTTQAQAQAQARVPFSCANCACVVPVHTWLMLALVLASYV